MILGIISIALGTIILWYTIKHPIIEDMDYGKGQLKGYVSGIGFIVVGVFTIIKQFVN